MQLGYAIWAPELEWMLGTGFYIDDIDGDLMQRLNMSSNDELGDLVMPLSNRFIR